MQLYRNIFLTIFSLVLLNTAYADLPAARSPVLNGIASLNYNYQKRSFALNWTKSDDKYNKDYNFSHYELEQKNQSGNTHCCPINF